MTLSATERAERLKHRLAATPQHLLINGKRVEPASGETFETINPATGEVLARVARGNAADIDRAVERRAPRIRRSGLAAHERDTTAPICCCGSRT